MKILWIKRILLDECTEYRSILDLIKVILSMYI